VINSVKVLDGANHTLFSQSSVPVQGDASPPSHTTFTFPPLVASTLSIRIDASNLTADFGAEDVGLDNVHFSQVPEPSTAMLAMIGGFGAGLIARRLSRYRAARR
jgi:hypothetical protein